MEIIESNNLTQVSLDQKQWRNLGFKNIKGKVIDRHGNLYETLKKKVESKLESMTPPTQGSRHSKRIAGEDLSPAPGPIATSQPSLSQPLVGSQLSPVVQSPTVSQSSQSSLTIQSPAVCPFKFLPPSSQSPTLRRQDYKLSFQTGEEIALRNSLTLFTQPSLPTSSGDIPRDFLINGSDQTSMAQSNLLEQAAVATYQQQATTNMTQPITFQQQAPIYMAQPATGGKYHIIDYM
ncbi:hypothetical protein BELL_1568g00010 [Botrytis elliptica]|uniref:Uncharacterized protein n=1 Tax=Botrytis elliptica TaxID=278938 RepID=A0A4Z1IAN1_9HELO|nr:hypothetical protein BELL_1568g00010 [Botrytis elliptica]